MNGHSVDAGGERLFARIVFGVVGLLALASGVWDIGSAVGLAPRVFGAFLAVVGLCALVGAVGGRARWAAWPVWASAVVLFVIGAVALVSEFRDRANFGWSDQRHLAFGVVCTVIGLVMIALAWRNRPDWPPRILAGLGKPNKTPLENMKDAVELLGVTGIVLGATAFWFTNVYIPSTRLPAVNAEIKLTSSDPSSVHSTFTFQNASDFRVRVLSSYFNIVLTDEGTGYGAAASQCAIEAQGNGSLPEWPGSSSALGRQAGVVINAGRLVQDGSWLEPHEKMVFGVVSPIPRDSGPPKERVAHATVDMTVARGDRIALVPEWTPASNPPFETDMPEAANASACALRAHLIHAGTARWAVLEESGFNTLTRDPIEIWTNWWVGSDGGVMAADYPVKDSVPMGVGKDSTPADQQHLGSKVEQLFGLVSISTVEEITVAAPSP